MTYEVKKVDNCFSDAQSYEYKVPIICAELVKRMTDWDITENHKYRRPMFVGERDGSHSKGILKANVFRVSFRNDRWEQEKIDFELWLEQQPTDD